MARLGLEVVDSGGREGAHDQARDPDPGSAAARQHETLLGERAIPIVVGISFAAKSLDPGTLILGEIASHNPTGFKVLLFDSNGNRASGGFSWAVKGV